MNSDHEIVFDNSYARLPGQFYTRQLPVPVSSPALIRVNRALTGQLGLDADWLESEAGIQFIAGNELPEGSDPIATVYAGHQFGGWNPQLGDGRAILLGEVIAVDGLRYDIQLKGSGRTPYSRNGDGRAPLGPVLREYIVSEAMAVLGVPTTRALAAVTTGESVYRKSMLPGAILARVARSHIRIGTVEIFAARGDVPSLETLVRHVIDRHYPASENTENPVRALLDLVIAAQAGLVARWQLLGFIHGVMNTDNMLLSGETIDYGPCAFMDEFDPGRVLSSIDHGGRYAYGNQAHIAHWNLSVLAQSLLPVIDPDRNAAIESAQAAIDTFPGLYQAAFQKGLCRKLGIWAPTTDDEPLTQDFLQLMKDEATDFSLSFRRLSDLADQGNEEASIQHLFEFPAAFIPWLERWQQRLGSDPRDAATRQMSMYSVNPVYIPRNHLVEEVIEAAELQQDLEPFHSLVEVLSQPFEFDKRQTRYAIPPRSDQIVRQTFCGT